MDVSLNPHEARVLGVLIEKGYTTPDQYPLSLNAATNGCNQKSNRSPVVDFSEAEVDVALQGLQHKHLVGVSQPAGSRVTKYRHNAPQVLKLGEQEVAVLAELLMRGPQTAGELRTRASRMRSLATLEDVARVTATLIERGYARRLPPAPGSRAERWGQLLAPEPDFEDASSPPRSRPASPGPGPGPGSDASADGPRTAPVPDVDSRLTVLEASVALLKSQLEGLAAKLGEPLD